MAKPAPITVLTATVPDREEMLGNTIRSVRAQTVPVAAHLIHSHDRAGFGMTQYATAKNSLLRAVDTPWVAVLNDDDIWLEHHVETIRPYLAHADVVYSWDAGRTRPRVDCTDWPREKIVQHLNEFNIIDGNCLIRTRLLVKAGGFPVDWDTDAGRYTGSPAYYEDWELWRRLVPLGARFVCVPVETWHYGDGDWPRLTNGREAA